MLVYTTSDLWVCLFRTYFIVIRFTPPNTGSKIVFLVLRHQLTTVQAVLTEEEGVVSHNMIRWAEGLNRESIVLVEGSIQNPPEQQNIVKSTSIHKVEIKVEKVVLHPYLFLGY